MKPFSFRLDSVLTYRRYLEKRAQRDLFNARNEYRRGKEELKRLEDQRREVVKQCSEEGFRGIDVPLYQMYRSFVRKLDDDIERALRGLEEGKEKIEVQKAVLKRESIKKKTLEMVRDLQLKRYREGLEREEQKAIDELVMIRRGGRA